MITCIDIPITQLIDGCTGIARIMLFQYLIATHEVGHALGLYHEHQRLDRDDHVNINDDNVQQTATANFDKAQPHDIVTKDIPYDYKSMMGYSATVSMFLIFYRRYLFSIYFILFL